jgi:hypothetical protein
MDLVSEIDMKVTHLGHIKKMDIQKEIGAPILGQTILCSIAIQAIRDCHG